MKIGFDITTLSMPKTGIGQYQYNLLEALFKIDKKNSYNLYAFNLRDNQKYNNLDFAKKYTNVEINAYKIPQRLITAWWLISRWPRLENITDKCDVYQVSEICQQPTKAKTTAFIHDLTTVLYPQYHLKKNKVLFHFRAKGIKKYANAVLTNSHHTKQDIIDHLGIEKERIFVTPFAAHKRFRKINNQEKINKVLQKYKITTPYICYLGTIEPRKNLINLFEAFSALKKQEKIPHKLVLIGKNGWFFEEIHKKEKELKIENDIIHTGFVEDDEIPYILNGAEIFTYPSFYEGFGLPVLEAMACGTPVITSNISSLPEVGGNAAKYVNPYKPDDIAAQILSFIKSKEEREKYSKLGIARAETFSWKKCAKMHLEIYESLK